MSIHEQNQSTMHAADIDHLVFSVKDHLIGLPFHNIIQIVDSPSWTTLPSMPRYVKGVIQFMGEAIPLIDTRVMLSHQSMQEEVIELVKTFKMRKQDHLNWIEKLKDCVDNDKEITVEEDPHKCAFGKWYDTFTPNTLALSSYMRRFDKPHKVIHNLAVQAEELIREGRKREAKKLIHDAENNELIKLLDLFDGFEEQMRLSYQEYAVVIAHKGGKFSLSADSIKYFEKMDVIVRDVPLMGTISDKMISGIGRKKIGDVTEDVIMLHLDGLFDDDVLEQ